MAIMGAAITGLREKGDFGFPAVFTLTLNLDSDDHDDGDHDH
jgi:hypothetical protein